MMRSNKTMPDAHVHGLPFACIEATGQLFWQTKGSLLQTSPWPVYFARCDSAQCYQFFSRLTKEKKADQML